MLRAIWEFTPSTLLQEETRLWEDHGATYDPSQWTDLLLNATTLRVEWSKNGGTTWGGMNINPDKTNGYGRFNLNVPANIADGTEYLVRFVIDGVTYGPISVRWWG